MKWITRERPKIDRIACPWLIKRFIDNQAEFHYVPFNVVLKMAKEKNAIPFDIPGVEFTHYKDHCTFDYFLKKYKIKDPALQRIAVIVRGADTDRHDLSEHSAGLWAISAGLAYNNKNDHELLQIGMIIYDALYSWAKYIPDVKHTQQPFENLLLEVFNKFIKQKKGTKKVPKWAGEMRNIIQDQIDTNLALSLKEISKGLEINPSYLSREFSKYFENLSFGEYIRKLRIEKAIQMMQTNQYALTEIAYLTGFSDQSHFTRIFRKYTGKNPSAFKKSSAR
jgi:AraC-like DNA-binding protein